MAEISAIRRLELRTADRHALNAPAVGAGNHNGAHESGGDQQQLVSMPIIISAAMIMKET